MTSNEYDSWLAHHKALFQLNTDADQHMFVAWWPLLKGYGISELTEASNHIATRSTKLYRTDHLGALRARISEKKRERFQREAEQQQNAEITCQVCFGTGMAIVPHSRWVVNGEWQANGNSWPTAAVYCECVRGRVKYEAWTSFAQEKSDRKLPVGMTLARYEHFNPNWNQQMTDRENAEKDEAHARRVAQAADVQYSSTLKRLASKFELPRS